MHFYHIIESGHSMLRLLALALLFTLSVSTHHYLAIDQQKPVARPSPTTGEVVVTLECVPAMKAARHYHINVVDLNGDGHLDIVDIGPAAVKFGLHWLDVAPRDGQLSLKELNTAWSEKAAWWEKTASWLVSFAFSDFSPESVFTNCASAARPTVITTHGATPRAWKRAAKRRM
jgi:hypothetical protein